MYAGTFGAGVFKSTNNGVNWIQVNTGLTNLGVFSLDISKSNPNILACGTTNGGTSPGIYVTTNAGTSWTYSVTGITDTLAIQALAIDPVNPNNMYVGLFTGTGNSPVGMWRTTNGGANWLAASTGMGAIKNILSIAINPLNPNVIYAGTSFDFLASTGPQKIYKSVNAGVSWTDASTGLPSLTTDINPVRTLSISNVDTAVVLAGLFMNSTTNGGMFFTSNGGVLWTKIQTGLPSVVGTLCRSCLIRPGASNEFYAGFDAGGIYKTTNRGTSWTTFSGGSLTAASTIRAITFRATSSDSTVFAGASVGAIGVHEYSYNLVGITNPGSNIPKDFALHQNYPNPFNPSTNVVFDIPKASFVNITVFDVSGKVVKTLVNEQKTEGTYNVMFNASSLSSGIYFYKITVGNFTATKKMILVK
jgi:hypothetical protein